jgi:NAD-dependent SIR2 family protein deacetylase
MGNAPSKPEKEQADRLKEGFNELCTKAAHAIAEADILLVITGAGFSADSGLAVYNDIARIEPYANRSLAYHDLCEPHWLETEPDLFYGFWGACFDDYRETQPHKGYEVIARWRDWTNQKPVAGAVRKELNNEKSGAFFMFTSNVDAHSFDYFAAEEVRECHGNIETWQCATQGSCSLPGDLWRAPMTAHRFNVDKRTMLADPFRATSGVVEIDEKDDASSAATTGSGPGEKAPGEEEQPPKPRLGHTHKHTGQRKHTLRHMPAREHFRVSKSKKLQVGLQTEEACCSEQEQAAAHAAPQASEQAATQAACFPTTSFPRCPHCHGAARPAILMFGDQEWVDDDEQEEQYEKWVGVVKTLCHDRARSESEASSASGVSRTEIGSDSSATGGAGSGSTAEAASIFNVLAAPAEPERGHADPIASSTAAATATKDGTKAATKDGTSTRAVPDRVHPLAGMLEGFSRRSLRKQETIVTKRDGSKYVESLGADGQQKLDFITAGRATHLSAHTTSTKVRPSQPLKVTIVEIGCGANVTTCRGQAEHLLKRLGVVADTALVRINPEYPLADDKACESQVISIMAKGLEALLEIDSSLVEIRGQSGRACAGGD